MPVPGASVDVANPLRSSRSSVALANRCPSGDPKIGLPALFGQIRGLGERISAIDPVGPERPPKKTPPFSLRNENTIEAYDFLS
jgi:hypothetical protein